MKKTLLTLFTALACIASATAAEVTFDFTTNTYGQKVGSSEAGQENYITPGTTLTETPAVITVGTTEKKVRFWSGTQLRINKGGDITITVNDGTISKISILAGNTDVKNMTANDAKADNATNSSTATPYDWTFATPATSVKLVNPSSGKSVQLKKLTITYTQTGSGKDDAKIAFPQSSYDVIFGEAFDAPKVSTVSDGAVSYVSSNTSVADVDAVTGAVTVKAAGTTVIKATVAETEKYYGGTAQYTLHVTLPPATFELATSMADGKYILVNEAGKVAIPIDENKTYGYLYVTDATIDGGDIKTSATNAFTFTKEADGWTIVDSFHRYLAMDATHSSIQLYTEPEENYLWTVEVTDEGEATITNVGRSTYMIVWSNKYNNFTVGTSPTDGLPKLYIEKGSSAISAVAAEAVEANAPVEYFNLQGMKVSNPQSGIFIKRQGNKAIKVAL